MAQAKIMVERSQRIVTPVARVSYPTLFVPRAYQEGDDPKFSATLMVKKDEAGNAFADSLKKAQDAVLKTLYPKKMPMNIERYGVTDGDDVVDKEGKPVESAAGHWLIKASSKSKPAVVNADKSEIINAEEVYGGCWGKASIQAKAYGNPQKGGVSLELVAFQKVRDDTPFGGAAANRAAAVDEFDDESEM
jgi:hypothetical protein